MLTIQRLIEIFNDDGVNALATHQLAYKVNDEDGSVLIFDHKHGPKLSHNGIIISNTGDIICCPAPSTEYIAQADLANYNDYDAYELYDGTVCTIYYNQILDEWRASSRKSANIDNDHMPGCDISMMDGLIEAIGGDEYEKHLRNLNRDLCYTIGFHNSEIHPTSVDNFTWHVYTCTKNGEEREDMFPNVRVPNRIDDVSSLNGERPIYGVLLVGPQTRCIMPSELSNTARYFFYCDTVMRLLKANKGVKRLEFLMINFIIRSALDVKLPDAFPHLAAKYNAIERWIDDVLLTAVKILNDDKTADLDIVPASNALINVVSNSISKPTLKQYPNLLRQMTFNLGPRCLYNIYADNCLK